MTTTRRCFLQASGAVLLGVAAAGCRHHLEQEKYAMGIDIRQCGRKDGCTACIDACHLAHNVPRIDDDLRHEIKWIWKESYHASFPSQIHPYTEDALKDQKVLVLCNHCDSPPCVRVCPTQATFKRADGLVMMDMHRCIGCRYCMGACPYGSRSFNFKDPTPYLTQALNRDYPKRMKGVVEKCSFCPERLAQGLSPACVQACAEQGTGALCFGKIPVIESGHGAHGKAHPAATSRITELLRTSHTIRRKPNLGTGPNVFYKVC